MPPNRFRTVFTPTSEDGASLTLARDGKGWTVHYVSSQAANELAARIDKTFRPPVKPILLIKGVDSGDFLITYPLNTTATSRGYLQPKYDVLRTNTFEGFNFGKPTDDEDVVSLLQGLPAGFVRSPFFGLGTNFELRYLTDAIEETHVTDLRIRSGRSAGLPAIAKSSYMLSRKMFDDARRAINRSHDRALTIAADEKRVFAHNTLLTAVNSTKYPAEHRRYRKDAIVEAIGKSLQADIALSFSDQETVIKAARSSARRLARAKPGELLELNRQIELVTLETLIERLKGMLEKGLKEPAWQTFFTDNPFVLRLAFGFPIVIFGGQVSVVGGKFSGIGGKISDFAVKAAASGNMTLLEIKTPGTNLLDTKNYRGEVHAPSRELVGAVNQILDQRYHLQKNIHALKDNAGAWDVETYAVQGLVIAGRSPDDKVRRKSFELFRNGLRSVTIITFDELLHKLQDLQEFLGVSPEAPAGVSLVRETVRGAK